MAIRTRQTDNDTWAEYARCTYTSLKSDFSSETMGTSESAGENARSDGLAGGEAIPVADPATFFCCLFFNCRNL